jgi:hypothetical protein
MAVTIPHTFTNGNIAEAAEVNANFTAVKLFVDNLQDGTNFTAGAITTNSIADGAITQLKIDPTVISSLSASGDDSGIVLGAQIFS